MKKLVLMAALLLPAFVLAQLSTGTIAGQLLTREGQPAAGVRVSAMAVPDPGVPVTGATALVSIGLTDAAGRYRLDNVPAGRYYVVAGLVDLPTYYPGVSSTNSARAINVLSGSPVTGINFTMVIPAGSLRERPGCQHEGAADRDAAHRVAGRTRRGAGANGPAGERGWDI